MVFNPNEELLRKHEGREIAIQKLKDIWDEQGGCASCGWHSAFYEVEHFLVPGIFDWLRSNQNDGRCFIVPCQNEYGETDHRGSKLWLTKKEIEELMTLWATDTTEVA